MNDLVIQGWKSLPFSELADEMGDGGTPSTTHQEYFGGSIPWVVIDDIQAEIRRTKSTLTELGVEKSSAKIWHAGSVILSTGATIGRVGIAMVPLCTKQGIIGIKCSKKITNKFLYYLLQSSTALLNRYSQGSTLREIRIPILSDLIFSIPPLAEQKKIAAILSSVDEVIEDTESEISKLEDLKKATLNELLTKGIGHAEFKDSEIGRIPKSWEVGTVGQVSSVITKGTTPSTEGHSFTDHGVSFLKAEAVCGDGTIDRRLISFISNETHQALSRSRLQASDIVMTIAGALGRVAVIDEALLPANTNQAVAIIRLDHSICNPQFARYWIQSTYISSEISKLKTVGAQPNLSLSQLGDLKIPLLGTDEQAEITSRMKVIDGLLTEKKGSKERYQSLKSALMQDLLTGKVRVKVN